MSGLLFRHKAGRRVGHGSADSFTGLGPNAPNGLTTPYQSWLGDVLPTSYQFTGGAVDAYGFTTLHSYLYAANIVADPTSPSGFCMRIKFPDIDGPDGGYWPGVDFGGAGPMKLTVGGLGASGRRPKVLYIHMWRRYSPNWSQAGEYSATNTIVDSGTSKTGTTLTQLVDTAKSWTVNEHVGRFIRFAANSERGVKIESNTATTLVLETGKKLTGTLVGTNYYICTVAHSGTIGSNAGTKPAFFALHTATYTWAGTDPKSGTRQSYDNPYIGGGTYNVTGGGGAITEGLTYNFANQNAKVWDGVTVDGSGYPVWSTTAGYGIYPNPRSINAIVGTGSEGVLLKEEFILQLNDVGSDNGKYRAYVGGVLVETADNVRYVEPYYSAFSLGASYIPTIGGSPRDVGLTPSDPYFTTLNTDLTHGGGSRVPVGRDMYQDWIALCIGLSDVNLI